MDDEFELLRQVIKISIIGFFPVYFLNLVLIDLTYLWLGIYLVLIISAIGFRSGILKFKKGRVVYTGS